MGFCPSVYIFIYQLIFLKIIWAFLETLHAVPHCLRAVKMILTRSIKGKKHLTKQKWYLKIQALTESISQMSTQLEKTIPSSLATDQLACSTFQEIQRLISAKKFEDALIRIGNVKLLSI